MTAVHFIQKFVEGAIDAWNAGHNFSDAGDGNLVGVHLRVNARLAHGVATTAENLLAGQTLLEGTRKTRSVNIAGALTRHDHD
jgi:hypothetical protein